MSWKLMVECTRFVKTAGWMLVLTTSFWGCSKHFTLAPDREFLSLQQHVLDKDGYKKGVFENSYCRVQARFVEDDYEHSIVEVEVINTGKKTYDVIPQNFYLTGSIIPNSPMNAIEPGQLLKSLDDDAQNLSERSKENSFQGVDTLTGSLPGADKDPDIQKAKNDLEKRNAEKQKEAKLAIKRTRKKDRLKKYLLNTTHLTPGKTAKGWIVFDSEYKGRGRAKLSYPNDICPAETLWLVE